MTILVTTDLGNIVMSSLFDERNHQIVNASNNLAGISKSHAQSIFFESDIATIIRTCFDTPMSAAQA